MTERKKWTASEVITAVRKHYGAEKDGFGPEFAALDEFSLHPGVGGRRADLFVVRAWGGKPKGHERITIEVKVSRADFLREKAQPHKMDPFIRVSHRVYFATPEGVIKDTDVLGDIGHMLITERGVRIVRKGKRNDSPEPVSERAFVEAFRRASRAEARERAASDDPESQVLALQRQVAQLQRQNLTLEQRLNKETSALHNWVNVLSKVEGLPCVCGKMLSKPSRANLRSGYYYTATHADGVQCSNGYPQVDMEALVALVMPAPDTSK